MSRTDVFRLAEIFSDGMIFQRELPIVLYGEIFEECELEASITGPSMAASSPAGRDTVRQKYSKGPFKLVLPPQQAGRNYSLIVQAGRQTTALFHIYIGEVFVASGQSNMGMSLRDTLEYKEEDIKCNDDIRFFTVARNIAMTPEELGEGYEWAYNRSFLWDGCNEKTAPGFSAVAYHFAHKLYEKNRIPVGIINCSVGGSSIFGWMPEEAHLNSSSLKDVLTAYENDILQMDQETHLADLHEYLDSVKRDYYKEEFIKLWNGEMPSVYFDKPGRFCFKRPCRLYHTMMERIVDFTVRGMIWYQGESEAFGRNAAIYKDAMVALLNNLKAHSLNTEYAFHFVQIAPWDVEDAGEWEDICNKQREFFLENPSCGMITIGDSEAGNDIHPPRKKNVGHRLAYAALNCTYGIPYEFTGPTAVKAVLLANGGLEAAEAPSLEVCVKFIHNSMMHFEGEQGDFELESADGTVEKAQAEIRDNMVYLKPSGTLRPAYARYGWCSYPRIGLYNEAGIPASVFRVAID